ITLMNRLLPEGEMLEKPDGRDYLFRLRGANVPFAALSDGYRAYIGWIADLLYHVCMGAPSGKRLDENQGVVLVDEIDLHLHPEWQRRVIPMLSETLSSLQFIVTSHSPLVVGTLSASHVRVLNIEEPKGKAARSVVEPAQDELHGLSAD